MLISVVTCLVAGGAGVAPAAAAEEPVRPISSTAPLGNERLSNELTVTRYAKATIPSYARAFPTNSARRIVRLRFQTEDGFPEVYLVLRSYVAPNGITWIKVRLPMRPNGTTGWVERESLGPLIALRTHLTVVRGKRATLRKAGKVIWSAPVGTGAPGTPTPAGRFWVREKFRVPASARSSYGPYAFGTAAYSVLSEWPRGGVVGIHGTSQPGLIPGRPSHGCIRVRNPEVSRLYRLMPVGTPILIR